MKSRGGRMVIVGGQKSEFSLVQAAYQLAEAAGIGECTVILPDSLRRTVGETGYTFFVPASASGSLGRAALGEILDVAHDSDAMVLGYNLTNNAETGIMVESLIRQFERRVVVTEETIHILKFHPDLITGNPKTLLVTTMSGLFELANNHHLPISIKPAGGVLGKMEILQQLVDISRCGYMVFDQEIMVAAEGRISLTPLNQTLSDFSPAVAGIAGTFWIQHPGKAFESLSAAAYALRQAAAASQLTDSTLARGVTHAISSLEQ